ncbi:MULTISPECIES: hypothetical protein [unclassified Variovorax]|uniref:hypothetical protein n=1 Tax=unclassified Variovorax TaxID=663243 RepID=UPI003F48218D
MQTKETRMRPSMHTMIRATAFALAGCTGAQPRPYPGSRSTEEDQGALAQHMDARFSDRLNARFGLVARPDASKAGIDKAADDLAARLA